ncbi:MAG: class I SAM-dependent methyltransferase [Armatimonadetes bacterium]|nr:class I SAM-dependent methyltransferase [Armatimonadota bacterium]
MDTTTLHEQNRVAWNEAANQYAREIEADVAFLRAGGKNFCPPEFEYLRDLNAWCDCAIHLQCAGGKDTLSLLNLGAKRVVGVDISDRMIEVARAKSAQLAAPAQWYRADVLETPDALNGVADLVYTGRGAIGWLMDLEAWARVVARLLKPGGKLYLFDGHPIGWVWDLAASEYRFDPDPRYGNYFDEKVATAQGWSESYIAADAVPVTAEQAKKHERQWTLSAIVNAVIAAGLRVERIGEHPDAFWTQYPHMPDDVRRRLPNTFSLLATKSKPL